MKESYIQQKMPVLQQESVLSNKSSILPITWLYFLIIILLIIMDQWIKIYVKLHFFPGEIVPVFDWFYITYTENNGMAFGIEPFGEHSIGKIILTLIRLGLVSFVGVYLFRIIQQKKRWTLITSVVLIFSGALGNIIDNAFYDYIFPPSPFFPNGIMDSC
jgi:signal peptidase II